MARATLIAALSMGVVALGLSGPASAQRQYPAAEPKDTVAAAAPVQIMPGGISPLPPEIEQTLRAGDSFKECVNCPEMVVVPKGGFTMGTPIEEIDRQKGEDPQHYVTIPKPFAVGRFSITFDEWDACLTDGGCSGEKGDDHGFGRGRMPAQGINFEAAKSYLAWLSRKVGRTYRLPSETEREYFTRAGTTGPFWFVNPISQADANYASGTPYGGGPRGVDSKGPAVVDAYPPNPFGLYQVHGNVQEWTADCFNKRYTEDTPIDGAPWLEGDCSRHEVRGGLWNWAADKSRSGYRDDTSNYSGISLRVVRTLAAAK